VIGPVDLTHEEFRARVRLILNGEGNVTSIVGSTVQEDDSNVWAVDHWVSVFCGKESTHTYLHGASAIGLVNELAALIDALYLTGMDLEDWRSENGLCPRCGEPVEGTCGDCFGGRDTDGYSAREWAEMNSEFR
jgi:hypothetical protein